MKNIITLFFFVFMIYAKGFSQKKPTSASIKKPKLTIKKNPSTDKKPENNAIQALKNSTDSTVTVQIKKETVDTESLDALKAAEDFAKSQKDVRKFDRSTLSVLPVVLYLDTTRDSKRNLLVKTNIKKVYGDVLISEKHYFNHLQTDIEETFKDIFKDDMIERQFWGLAPKTVDNSERFSLLNPLAGIKSKYKKTKNSLTLNNLSNKIMKIGFGETYSYELPTDTVGKAIKAYIENSDIPYNMLSVWKNKTTLITRAEFSIGELQKKTKVDVEKFENFKKLLQRNYLLVSAVNNPYKRTPDDAFYRANVSGFLYRILLNDNTITDILNNDFSAKTSMKLEYLGMVKIENLKLDPRSDEFIDRYNIKGGLFDVSVNGKNVQKYGGDGVAELFYKSIIAIFEETGRIADRYFKDGEYKCATMIYQQQIELSAKFPDIKMDVGNANLKLKDCREQLQKNATFNELKFQHAKNDERIARLELEKNQNAIIKMSDERRMALIHKLQPFFYSRECEKRDFNLYDQYFFSQSATNALVQELERRLDEFKTRARLQKVNPILSDIGRQEGVFVDQRFRVYEQIKKEDGTIEKKKYATIRAIKIAENTEKYRTFNVKNTKDSLKKAEDSLFTFSRFRQMDGKSLSDGMLIEQDDDYALSFVGGYQLVSGNSGFLLGLDYRLSKILKTKSFTSGLKFGFDVGFSSLKTEKSENGVFNAQLHLSKEFYYSTKFDFRPTIGYNLLGGFYVGLATPINIIGKASRFTKFKIVPTLCYAGGSSGELKGSSNSSSEPYTVKSGLLGSLQFKLEL